MSPTKTNIRKFIEETYIATEAVCCLDVFRDIQLRLEGESGNECDIFVRAELYQGRAWMNGLSINYQHNYEYALYNTTFEGTIKDKNKLVESILEFISQVKEAQ